MDGSNHDHPNDGDSTMPRLADGGGGHTIHVMLLAPDQAVVELLRILGAPGLLLILIGTAFAVVGWYSWGRGASRGIRTLSQVWDRIALPIRAEITFWAWSLIALLAVTIAVRLLVGIEAANANGQIDVPRDWAPVLLVLEAPAVPITWWAPLLAVATIAIARVAAPAKWRSAQIFVVIVWAPAMIAGALVGGLLVLWVTVTLAGNGLAALNESEPVYRWDWWWSAVGALILATGLWWPAWGAWVTLTELEGDS